MTRAVLLLACLLAACTERPAAPYVQLVLVHDIPALPEYLAGARAWEPLGFDVGYAASGLPECEPGWYRPGGVVDCQITITLVRWEHLIEQEGTAALSDRYRHSIAIDTRVTGRDLQAATAHEVGHLILDTADHSQGGIMGGASAGLTDVDIAFACEHIHICI